MYVSGIACGVLSLSCLQCGSYLKCCGFGLKRAIWESDLLLKELLKKQKITTLEMLIMKKVTTYKNV